MAANIFLDLDGAPKNTQGLKIFAYDYIGAHAYILNFTNLLVQPLRRALAYISLIVSVNSSGHNMKIDLPYSP